MENLAHIAEKTLDAGRITLIEDDVDNALVAELKPDQVADLPATKAIRWINVDGVGDGRIVDLLGEKFGLHTLVREDIKSTTQRPHLEEYDECLFIVLHMLYVDDRQKKIASEQMSIVFGKGFVL